MDNPLVKCKEIPTNVMIKGTKEGRAASHAISHLQDRGVSYAYSITVKFSLPH